MVIPSKILEEKIQQFLKEDIGQGDITAQALIPANLTAKAEVIAKESGVVAGIVESIIICNYLELKAKPKVSDGNYIKSKQVLLEISGNAQTILSLERTLLNLLSRMSGIATATRSFTKQLEESGFKTKIAATRKSAPGLMYFDKKAVELGGGDSHRLHLDDMILIKDNHLTIVGSVEEAIRKAKEKASFTKKIEVEVTNTDDALKAAKAGADIIMLDNFSPKEAKATSETMSKRGLDSVLLEVSGKITGENLLDYAAANVDVISMGALTHSVKALDVSLEIIKQ